MKEFLIVTLIVAVTIPAIIAALSFVHMENGFRIIGTGRIIRYVIVTEIFAWILMAIPSGGAA